MVLANVLPVVLYLLRMRKKDATTTCSKACDRAYGVAFLDFCNVRILFSQAKGPLNSTV